MGFRSTVTTVIISELNHPLTFMAAGLKDARQRSSDEDSSGDVTTPSPVDIFVLILFISLPSNSWFFTNIHSHPAAWRRGNTEQCD